MEICDCAAENRGWIVLNSLWTFLWKTRKTPFFNTREGSFATVVAIRDKLRRGKRLENWELDYYRTHRAVVELRGVESAEEQAEKRRLLELLGG